MDDLNKPIRPVSRDENDRFKVQKIEAYKHDDPPETKFVGNPPEEKKIKAAISSSMLMFFKKIFNAFIPEKAGVKGVLSPDEVLDDIRKILSLLISIRDEDPANDPKFAHKFSKAWHNLVDHYLHHTKTKEPTKVNLDKVNIFLQSVHHFPEDDEHNLAFYLQKYTEEDWFPIPFFKLIGRLHDDYFSKGKQSELDTWIKLLNELLSEARSQLL